LCGCNVGRIMHLAHPSVHLSAPYGLITQKQKKKCRKIKDGINVPQGTSKWTANFQLKTSKVKVTGCQKPQKIATCLPHIRCTCLLSGGGSSTGGLGADCKVGQAIVRPNLLT